MFWRYSKFEFSGPLIEILYASQHDAILQLDVHKVQVEMQTHTAYIPIRHEQRILHPGITLHDTNLAVEIEKLWQESCENNRVSSAHMRATGYVGPDEASSRQVASLIADAQAQGYLSAGH